MHLASISAVDHICESYGDDELRQKLVLTAYADIRIQKMEVYRDRKHKTSDQNMTLYIDMFEPSVITIKN